MADPLQDSILGALQGSFFSPYAGSIPASTQGKPTDVQSDTDWLLNKLYRQHIGNIAAGVHAPLRGGELAANFIGGPLFGGVAPMLAGAVPAAAKFAKPGAALEELEKALSQLESAPKYVTPAQSQPAPDISAEGIAKALESDPGASIFDIAKSKIKGWQQKTKDVLNEADIREQQAHQLKTYEKAFSPLDWSKERATHQKGYMDPFATEPNYMASDALREHVQGLGFNPDLPLLKGGSSSRRKSTALPEPEKKVYERGLFFTADPKVASGYGEGGTGVYYARAPKALQFDWKKGTGSSDYSSEHMTPVIDMARNKGADMLVVRGMYDIGSGSPQDQYVVLNPSIVRRQQAAFDPSKLNLNNLLAGLAGAGVALPAVSGAMNER